MGATDQRVLELSLWIVDRIQGSMGNQTELKRTPESERLLQDRFTNYYRQSGINLSDAQVKKLYEMVTDELFGFGPIEPLLRDEANSEVMVNGPNTVYIEQKGKVILTPVRFANDDHVPEGDRPHHPPAWPAHRSQVADGRRTPARRLARERDHPAAAPSIGPTITIRKFTKKKLDGRRSDPVRLDDRADGRVPARLRGQPAEYCRLRRHRLGQDDPAERALDLHPRRGADRHDRGQRPNSSWARITWCALEAQAG